jgi:hypothetical protein
VRLVFLHLMLQAIEPGSCESSPFSPFFFVPGGRKTSIPASVVPLHHHRLQVELRGKLARLLDSLFLSVAPLFNLSPLTPTRFLADPHRRRSSGASSTAAPPTDGPRPRGAAEAPALASRSPRQCPRASLLAAVTTASRTCTASSTFGACLDGSPAWPPRHPPTPPVSVRAR